MFEKGVSTGATNNQFLYWVLGLALPFGKSKYNSLLARRKISATRLNRSKTKSAFVVVVGAAIVIS